MMYGSVCPGRTKRSAPTPAGPTMSFGSHAFTSPMRAWMSMAAEHGAARPPLLSVVIPIYNEEATLPELYRRLTQVLSQGGPDFTYEILFVNDGSSDASVSILAKLHTDDPTIKVINLSRNFGHQAAITAGLDYARGDVIICMDGDLQDPPELIPKLITKWGEGHDIVFAVRKARKEGIVKRTCYAVFYRLLSRLSKVSIPLDAGDFALMDRRVVDCLKTFPERSRFIRGLRAWVGFRQTCPVTPTAKWTMTSAASAIGSDRAWTVWRTAGAQGGASPSCVPSWSRSAATAASSWARR